MVKHGPMFAVVNQLKIFSGGDRRGTGSPSGLLKTMSTVSKVMKQCDISCVSPSPSTQKSDRNEFRSTSRKHNDWVQRTHVQDPCNSEGTNLKTLQDYFTTEFKTVFKGKIRQNGRRW